MKWSKRLSKCFFSSFSHPLTDVIIYSELTKENVEVLSKVLIGNAAEEEIKNRGIVSPITPFLIKVTTFIQDYLNGKKRDFIEIPLKIDTLTSFQQKVLTTARKIPYGKLWSYSELAYKSGFPNAIRAVATVMRKNPFPIIIPCHRVILKNGKYGAYCGQREGKDVEIKKNLINLEQRRGDK